MPNWAEGTLKLRGNKHDLTCFLEEALKAAETIGDSAKIANGEKVKLRPIKMKYGRSMYTFIAPNDLGFYVAGTRRAFINDKILEIFWDDRNTKDEEDEQVIYLPSFRQAWIVEASDLARLSRYFCIDIKIYAFEKGGCFNQDIEIHKGEIIKDETIKFDVDDYDWDCICPGLGG